jgi:hypothetical protein
MSCSICIGELSESNKITTPCDHTFCNTCLTHWLMTNHSCPMCRHEICSKPNVHSSGDEEDDEEGDDDGVDLVEEYNIPKNSVTVVNKYIHMFEDEMFNLIDNIDNDSYLRSRSVHYVNDMYVMKVCYYHNNKIVSANIVYDPENVYAKMIYSMKYNVPKAKNLRRCINRTNKGMKRMNNYKNGYGKRNRIKNF